jgi:DNA-binding transcriptional ArsR family regulator
MPKHSPRLDRVFHPLANPTRRAVIERLGRGPSAVTDLAAPFAMALPSFVQHLRVLEAAGLVRTRKVGRVRTVRIAPERIEQAERWMQRQRALWEQRFDQFDDYVTNLKEDP